MQHVPATTPPPQSDHSCMQQVEELFLADHKPAGNKVHTFPEHFSQEGKHSLIVHQHQSE